MVLEKTVITTEIFLNDVEQYTVMLKILENILLELFLNLDIVEMTAYEFPVVLVEHSVVGNVSLL